MNRQTVALLGASGTMGFQAFKELWKRRDRFDITILVLPSEKRAGLFQEYEQEAGVPDVDRGVAQGRGFTIVWGDATHYEDVLAAVSGADWVLSAMAYISPQADYRPHLAKAVNTDAIHNILRAIQAQPGGIERVRLIYTGTVAETGNRPAGIHMGRVGDPLKPSIFDYYALTKIAGERAVLESSLRRWASLRMTFIMPTSFKEMTALQDVIRYHMPLASYMENITDRDAGLGLVNCLDIPDDSDFWRRVYNMGGGPKMRCTAYDLNTRLLQMNGLSGLASCSERRWYALRNFHMQYYEDSTILNDYLYYWRDSLEDYFQLIEQEMPSGLKLARSLAKKAAIFRRLLENVLYSQSKALVENHLNGTAYWARSQNQARLSAFYGSQAAYDAIPAWDAAPLSIDRDPPWQRLDHGYDESKQVLNLSVDDLQAAARFRGGRLLSEHWTGDLYAPLDWECGFEHRFEARPYTVLKAGHWCPECLSPPWNFDQQAGRNPFFAQVWYADHEPSEENIYPLSGMNDILDADTAWQQRKKRL